MKSQTKTFLSIAGVLVAVTPSVAAGEADDEHHVLDEVIVTATPLDRTVEQLAQPTSIIDGDALTRKQSSSIGETIADQPGVTSSYFGPVASRPVIRGQFGERVRVLSNGLDALDASALSEDHSVSLDSILADRIEVVRGPATLLYGSGAAGGLVNIVDSRIHEKPLESSFGGAVSLSIDSAIGKESAAVKFDAGTDALMFHFDYFSRDTDNVEIPGFAESFAIRALEDELDGEPERVVENTNSETSGAAGAVTFMGKLGYVGVAVSSYDTNYGIPGHSHDEPGADDEAVRIDLDQTRVDLKGELRLDGRFEVIRFHLANNEYEHVELEGADVGTVFDTQGIDGRVEFRHKPFGGLEGAFGLQYKDIDFGASGDEAFVPPSVTEQLSLFAFEELSVNDRWTLQASARIENQRLTTPVLPNYDETAIGASLGAIWSASNKITLSANLGVTERHPTPTELYANGPHVAVQRYERGAISAGGTAFTTEQSTNLDLTLRARFDRVEINVTGFINDVDDYILLGPTAAFIDGLQVFDYVQRDVEMLGFEAEGLFDIFQSSAGHLHARISSDFVFAEQKDSGDYLSRIPPLRIGLGLHFTREPFEASIQTRYHDRQDKTAANELSTASYTLIDVDASYRLFDDQLLLFVRGTNLGDEDARRHSSALKDLVPLPGRSVHLGLRWDF